MYCKSIRSIRISVHQPQEHKIRIFISKMFLQGPWKKAWNHVIDQKENWGGPTISTSMKLTINSIFTRRYYNQLHSHQIYIFGCVINRMKNKNKKNKKKKNSRLYVWKIALKQLSERFHKSRYTYNIHTFYVNRT